MTELYNDFTLLDQNPPAPAQVAGNFARDQSAHRPAFNGIINRSPRTSVSSLRFEAAPLDNPNDNAVPFLSADHLSRLAAAAAATAATTAIVVHSQHTAADADENTEVLVSEDQPDSYSLLNGETSSRQQVSAKRRTAHRSRSSTTASLPELAQLSLHGAGTAISRCNCANPSPICEVTCVHDEGCPEHGADAPVAVPASLLTALTSAVSSSAHHQVPGSLDRSSDSFFVSPSPLATDSEDGPASMQRRASISSAPWPLPLPPAATAAHAAPYTAINPTTSAATESNLPSPSPLESRSNASRSASRSASRLDFLLHGFDAPSQALLKQPCSNSHDADDDEGCALCQRNAILDAEAGLSASQHAPVAQQASLAKRVSPRHHLNGHEEDGDDDNNDSHTDTSNSPPSQSAELSRAQQQPATVHTEPSPPAHATAVTDDDRDGFGTHAGDKRPDPESEASALAAAAEALASVSQHQLTPPDRMQGAASSALESLAVSSTGDDAQGETEGEASEAGDDADHSILFGAPDLERDPQAVNQAGAGRDPAGGPRKRKRPKMHELDDSQRERVRLSNRLAAQRHRQRNRSTKQYYAVEMERLNSRHMALQRELEALTVEAHTLHRLIRTMHQLPRSQHMFLSESFSASMPAETPSYVSAGDHFSTALPTPSFNAGAASNHQLLLAAAAAAAAAASVGPNNALHQLAAPPTTMNSANSALGFAANNSAFANAVRSAYASHVGDGGAGAAAAAGPAPGSAAVPLQALMAAAAAASVAANGRGSFDATAQPYHMSSAVAAAAALAAVATSNGGHLARYASTLAQQRGQQLSAPSLDQSAYLPAAATGHNTASMSAETAAFMAVYGADNSDSNLYAALAAAARSQHSEDRS